MFSPENIYTVEPNFYIMNRLTSVENEQDALSLTVNIWDDKKIDTSTDPDVLDLYTTKKLESKHNQ
jgi:glycogen synthase